MKVVNRVLVALVAALMGLFVALPGTAQAGMDNQMSLVDGGGRTMTIQQWDTFLDGVFPLDRNRLTREWFHPARPEYNVVGPAADKFEGTLELGYQVGFPGRWVWASTLPHHPNILPRRRRHLPAGFNPLGSVITPNLFPAPRSPDPVTARHPGGRDLLGGRRRPEGSVAVANAHGTVTGAAGGAAAPPSPG